MIFNSILQHNPHLIALEDEFNQITYGQLLNEIEVKVTQLKSVACLAIQLDNSVEWVLWDLACLKAGIPCVPVPPFFTDAQVNHILESANVSHIVLKNGRNAQVHLHQRNNEQRKTDQKKSDSFHLPEGTAKITFTSGTTGTPKGVCLTASLLETVASGIAEKLGHGFTGRHLSIMPLAVLLENIAGVYTALIAGCQIHLYSARSAGQSYERLHQFILKNQANTLILVPEMLRSLIKQVRALGPLPSLRFIAVGGSKIDSKLIIDARSLGLPVYEGYGLSECGSVISINTPDDDRPGSAGRLLPHVQLIPPPDATISSSTHEICFLNKGFLGYLGEGAPDIIETGDLGEFDNNGFLSITGRKKNVLITSYGRNISPEWIESILLMQPAIAQAVIYGDGKASLSALIVPTVFSDSNSVCDKNSESSTNLKTAITQVNSELPDYARIKSYQCVDPFTLEAGTLTATGRPKRDTIFDLYISKSSQHPFSQTTCY